MAPKADKSELIGMHERMLHYHERHGGWHIFNAIYWGIYIFIVGVIFVFMNAFSYSVTTAIGVSLVILSLMVVVFGFVKALHGKFMKKYG